MLHDLGPPVNPLGLRVGAGRLLRVGECVGHTLYALVHGRDVGRSDRSVGRLETLGQALSLPTCRGDGREPVGTSRPRESMEGLVQAGRCGAIVLSQARAELAQLVKPPGGVQQVLPAQLPELFGEEIVGIR